MHSLSDVTVCDNDKCNVQITAAIICLDYMYRYAIFHSPFMLHGTKFLKQSNMLFKLAVRYIYIYINRNKPKFVYYFFNISNISRDKIFP